MLIGQHHGKYQTRELKQHNYVTSICIFNENEKGFKLKSFKVHGSKNWTFYSYRGIIAKKYSGKWIILLRYNCQFLSAKKYATTVNVSQNPANVPMIPSWIFSILLIIKVHSKPPAKRRTSSRKKCILHFRNLYTITDHVHTLTTARLKPGLFFPSSFNMT